MEKVTVKVVQRPVHVDYECPHCEEEIEIPYNDFCDEVGDPCDWVYSKITCPECEKTIEIESDDWQ